MSGRSLVPDLPLFQDEADRALGIFKRLTLFDMPGHPSMGEVGGPWLFPIVAAIFGSFDAKLQQRMIQEFFLLVPKKNSKTPSGALIMVTAMIMNRRPNAEFLLIAPTKQVADRSFEHAAGTIRNDPVLRDIFDITAHIRKITYIDPSASGRGSYLQVKAADTDVIAGIVSTGVLVDETHVFAKKARADQVFREIRGAMGARKDGFLIQISTQSRETPAGQFAAELKMAKAVRDDKLLDADGNKINFPMLPIIYELPRNIEKNDGWKNRAYWPLVNPNLGRSVDEAFLVRELQMAELNGQAALALFASQHFNVEIGLSLQSDSWAGAFYWDENAEPNLTLEELIRACNVITAGIDGGGLDDLLSCSFLGRVKGSSEWLHWSKTWAHEIVLERRKSEAPTLLDFSAQGDLTIVKDIKAAFWEVADLISRVDKSGKLQTIGFDPVGVKLIVEALEAKGIAKERIVGVSQGWQLQGAIKAAEVKLSSGQLTHAGQPIMRWAVNNAKVEPKGNAITITKQAAGTAKIDPLMGLFDAVSLMSDSPENQTSGWQTDNVAALMKKIEAAAAAMAPAR
ncbi:MAG: terminase large subunit [Armatimonadota bacterium]|nr:terminase large subunit [Armatimonadota bacterium]